MQLTTADCCVCEGRDLAGGELVRLWRRWSLDGLLGIWERNKHLGEEAGGEKASLIDLQFDALRPLHYPQGEYLTELHREVRVEYPIGWR